MQDIQLLEPGIYRGISEAHYHALPYCSNSRLKQLAISGKHLKQSMEEPFKPTSSTRMGSALDCLLLDPAEWINWTALMPGETYSKGKGYEKKAKHIELRGKGHFAEYSLNATEYETVLGMKKAIEENEEANGLITKGDSSMNQVVIIFDWFGVRLKTRLDRLIDVDGVIGFDLKTINDASTRGIERQIWKLKYHFQSFLYRLGCHSNGIRPEDFKFLFVQNSAPYNVQVKSLSEEYYSEAMRELEPLTQRWKYCTENDIYPDYNDGPKIIEPPRWAFDIDYEKLYVSDLPKLQKQAA